MYAIRSYYVPSEAYVKETDYFGIASGKDEDKFEAACLTPVRSELVPAPYIAEFRNNFV